MKNKKLFGPLTSVLLLVAALSCAPAAFADKYDGVTVTFDWPIEFVQKAAIDALTVAGAKIDKQEPTLVEGKRKNKVGAFVGSGGEVLSVKMTAVDPNKTEAQIRTTKTFVGRAGQKVWDQTIVDEMNKTLNGATGAAPGTKNGQAASSGTSNTH